MGIAKGLVTRDWNIAKNTYDRWAEEYDELVGMYRDTDGIYSVVVLPYKIMEK